MSCDNVAKILWLENQLTKQQSEINELININEVVVNTLGKMAAALESGFGTGVETGGKKK